jgi:hypothetical protein
LAFFVLMELAAGLLLPGATMLLFLLALETRRRGGRKKNKRPMPGETQLDGKWHMRGFTPLDEQHTGHPIVFTLAPHFP